MTFERIEKDDYDNICNVCILPKARLTSDHIPPKCTGNAGKGEFQFYFSRIADAETNRYSEGLQFLTICQGCHRLISEYDTAISRLYKHFQHNRIKQGETRTLKIKPNKIIRSVFGHLVAAKKSHQKSKFDEIFCSAVLDKSIPIKCDLSFYVLYYPYDSIRVIRDLVLIKEFNIENVCIFNIMKIDPFAFIITDKPVIDMPYTSWEKYFEIPVEKDEEVKFNFTNICGENLPEDDPNLSKLMGSAAYYSAIGIKKKKIRRSKK